MKIVKTASGKNKIKMSKKEWTSIGKKAGWIKKASFHRTIDKKENIVIEYNGGENIIFDKLIEDPYLKKFSEENLRKYAFLIDRAIVKFLTGDVAREQNDGFLGLPYQPHRLVRWIADIFAYYGRELDSPLIERLVNKFLSDRILYCYHNSNPDDDDDDNPSYQAPYSDYFLGDYA